MSETLEKPSTQSLLEELESISRSLTGETATDKTLSADCFHTDVPTLNEDIMISTTSHGDEIIPGSHSIKENIDISHASVLPGQQSLFDEEQQATNATELPAPTPSGENPFLPKHIKDRLNKEKANYRQTQNNTQQELSSIPLSQQNIVDQLVKKYLPIIEKELREKLSKQMNTD